MATVGDAVRPKIRPRKIIERPRLIRLLDDSNTRLRLLIGAAGYGKTTLAEQWAARAGRRVAWVRCRRSSSDIAVVSRLMAAAGATMIPGCDRRFEQRLSVTPDPSREVDILAEILAEDIAAWPSDAWVVIDDYHYVMETVAAERFVEVIASQSPIQLLVASRTRPSWVSSRDLVYQHAIEIDQADLAMTSSEADQALSAVTGIRRAEIIAVAAGWPAVIGLAALARLPTAESTPAIPAELFSFFAEEVLSSIEPRLRDLLALIAFLPQVDDALLDRLSGEPQRDVLLAGLATGLLEVRAAGLELHPLAASFFASRSCEQCAFEVEPLIRASVDWYMAHGEWDAAFDLLSRNGSVTDLSWLVETSLDALINSARLATLERWIASMPDPLSGTPYVMLARGEIALRQGHHTAAQTFAERALEGATREQGTLQVRSLLVAGRAAHAGSREPEA